MASATGHIGLQTRVQDWTHVHILTGPVATGHWTEAEPLAHKRQTQHQIKMKFQIKILSL